MTITIWIPGIPVGKGRARAVIRGGRIGHYTPKTTLGWEKGAKTLAKAAMRGRPPLEGPVEVLIVAWMPVPASWPAWKRAAALAGEIMPTTKPDKDNIEKAVMDALNGVAWRDDALAVDGRTTKRYADSPGVAVVVNALPAQAAGMAKRYSIGA